MLERFCIIRDVRLIRTYFIITAETDEEISGKIFWELLRGLKLPMNANFALVQQNFF